jgi:hypothetical protein
MEQLGLGRRHRNTIGEISRKHGTLLGLMRKVYGPSFASGLGDNQTLSEALAILDDESLGQVCRDHIGGSLSSKIEEHKLPT